MRYLKLLILLAVVSFAFPAKTFGLFAQPDKYIHSMPFGTQINTDRPVVEIPSAVKEITVESLNNETSLLEQLESKIVEKGFFADKDKGSESHFSFINNPWFIFLSAVLIVVIIFILLKIKKVL